MTRRKSDAEKQLSGTARADRRMPSPPAQVSDQLIMPRGLGQDKHAAKVWRLIVGELGGVVGPLDQISLLLLSKHVSFALRAAEELESEGLWTEDRRHGQQLVKHPAMQTFLWNSDRAVALLKSFGGTPRERLLLGELPSAGFDAQSAAMRLAAILEGAE